MADTDTIDRSAAQTRAATGPALREAGTAMILREPDMKWLDIPREELVPTLISSLYPGAKQESVNAVLDYCAAARLNVMLKPVHIVPMYVKPANGGQAGMRDVIMPGINHYRTQASRTGQYVGKTEPEFGPDLTETLSGTAITFPTWCKVTVKRKIGNVIAEFTAFEFWKENYATAGRDTQKPNAMWFKRPYGQLAKCTEAQALRMAFPELISDVTAEEMEGKTIDLTAEEIERKPAAVRSLDAFAGEGNVENSDRQGGQENRQAAEDAVVEEPIDETPGMPDAAWKPFYEPVEGAKPDWKPGWQWLNETVEGNNFTANVTQELAERYSSLLWAVHGVGGKQQKAVLAFVEKHGMIVPPAPEASMGGGDATAK